LHEMADYVLMTDSTSDLPAAYCQKNGLAVIPLTYIIDGVARADNEGAADGYHSFYNQLREGKLSTTSQITAEEYLAFMTPILESGKDILYIAFSSGLSGSYEGALNAAETLKDRFPDRRMRIVDSFGASLGEGLLVMHAVKMRDAGESLDAVADWVLENRLNAHHWFTVDDLGHLKRGGRLSSSSAAIGTLLRIKPVLSVNTEGKLVPVEKARSRKKAIKTLFKKMADNIEGWDRGAVAISHGDCLEDALTLREMVEKAYPCEEIVISPIGAVIGSHVGAGTLALFFMSGPRG
jgi:DegV family protein with EDD domain